MIPEMLDIGLLCVYKTDFTIWLLILFLNVLFFLKEIYFTLVVLVLMFAYYSSSL